MRVRLVVALACFLLAACGKGGEHVALHHYVNPHGEGWSAQDTLHYSLPPVNATADYELSLGMRVGNLFPYAGVWMVADLSLHNPERQLRDTLYFVTMQEGGMPQGTGINMQQSEQRLLSVRLTEGQSGDIAVYHIMRRETLPSVLDVGVKLARR
ncbi:MAG: gliding motility lipoprotein GldH [Prevotellaceae bacterium]|nr:gliding motility lipoprotein GldH [Prevotellaceae bacterium]